MNYDKERERHTSFCGSYCRLCDWFTGEFRVIFQSAMDALEIYGFKKQLEEEIDIDEFRSGLEIMALSNICPGCKAEAGRDPDRCDIRACAHNKGVDLCIECSDYPCDVLLNNPGVQRFDCLENLKEIEEEGFKKWVDGQWLEYVKNNQGF